LILGIGGRGPVGGRSGILNRCMADTMRGIIAMRRWVGVTEIAGADGYRDGRGWISGRVWMNMGYTSDKVVE
jgi:hypothetical protein